MQSESPRTQFKFDRQLWDRFIEIAQPYFYPLERRGSRTFLSLLGITLIAVVAFTFFLTTGLTKAGQLFFPKFFNELASGLVNNIDGLLASPAPYVAGVVLGVSALIFTALRQKIQQRWRQWSLLALLLFLSFAVNGANVSISFVFRFVETALNQREQETFYQFLFVYAGIIITAVPILVIYLYTRKKLALYWREWLTKDFLNRYFSNRSYYELDSNAANTEIDNPDQRITQDIKSFTAVTLSFLLDILDSILTLISFTVILYNISKTLTAGLLIYATFGTVVAVVAGRRLIGINYNQLRLEANFRYGMVHVRDNAESIAFYQGEGLERQQVVDRLMEAIRNFDLLIIWQALIELFQYGYNYFTRIVPYLIVAPLYFAGETDFGTFTQAAIAFSQLLSALSLITNRIDQIAEFAASINRLGAFHEQLVDPAQKHQQEEPTDRIATRLTPNLAIEDLTLRTPNSEQTLVEDLALSIDTGDRLLIVGSSGCGKSSLLRAIAGLWTNGSGVIARPDVRNMLFLPQRPYMLLGTLRDQLIYPRSEDDVSEAELEAVLRQVNLEALPERLGGMDIEKDWTNVLSLGEQQRLAFARILLTQPRYAILDEATSALDVSNERRLYELLRDMEIVYISVGHRPTLLDYHQKVLELDTGSGWQVFDAQEYGGMETGGFDAVLSDGEAGGAGGAGKGF